MARLLYVPLDETINILVNKAFADDCCILVRYDSCYVINFLHFSLRLSNTDQQEFIIKSLLTNPNWFLSPRGLFLCLVREVGKVNPFPTLDTF